MPGRVKYTPLPLSCLGLITQDSDDWLLIVNSDLPPLSPDKKADLVNSLLAELDAPQKPAGVPAPRLSVVRSVA